MGDNNYAEGGEIGSEGGMQGASKRDMGQTEPWPKCCSLNQGNSMQGEHGCQEGGGMSNGYMSTPPTTTSDTVDICPTQTSPSEPLEEEDDSQGEGEEGAKKRANVEPWPKCCSLNGGKSGGGSKCPSNGGGSIMGGQNSGLYMNDKTSFMDDKSSDMMNDKNSYMDEKNEMNDGENYNSGKTEMVNNKNFIDKSWMNDKGDNDKNSYMNDNNSYNDKNSYMNDKNSDVDDKNSEDKNSFMDSKESGSFKGGNAMMDGEGKNYMESSPLSKFKPNDYDTHSVDKSCEGDYKECNQGWNACKTPCFGAQSFGGNVYGGSVKESDQNDMNTVKAIAAMDTQKTVDMLGKHEGLQVTAGESHDQEPTNSEVQENDTKIAAALSGHNIGVAPQPQHPAEGLVQTGGEAVEPYKNTITPPGNKETL